MCNLDDPTMAEIVRSITTPEAGLYLNADPKEKSFQIKDDHFIFYTKRRLQLNVISRPDMRCKSCDKPVDGKAEHTFCCVHVGKNSVHAPIVKTAALHMREILGATSVVSYEVKLTPNEKCTKLEPRTDIMITNIVSGVCQLVDFIFPTVKEDATDSNTTVMMAEASKHKYYEDNYVLDGEEVVPAAIDTYGRWGEELKRLVKQVARYGSYNEREYGRIVNDLRTTMAIAHVRSIGKQMSVFLGRHLY